MEGWGPRAPGRGSETSAIWTARSDMAKGAPAEPTQAQPIKTASGTSGPVIETVTEPGVGGGNGAAIVRAPGRAPSRSRDTDTEVKHFVLDTNVLLHNP